MAGEYSLCHSRNSPNYEQEKEQHGPEFVSILSILATTTPQRNINYPVVVVLNGTEAGILAQAAKRTVRRAATRFIHGQDTVRY